MAKEGPVVEELWPQRTHKGYWGQWGALGAAIVAAEGAVVAAALVTSGGRGQAMPQELARDGLVLIGSWLVVLILLGEVRIYPRKSGREQFVSLARAIVGGSVVAVVIRPFLLPQTPLNLGQYGLATVLAMGLFWLTYRLLQALWAKRLERRYLVVSENSLGSLLEELRRGSFYECHEVVGTVSSDQGPLPQGLPATGGESPWEAVPSLVQALSANCVVIDRAAELPAEAVQAGVKCRDQGVRVLTPVSAYEQIAYKTPLGELERAFAGATCQPPEGLYGRHLKRVTEVALTVLLLPVGAVIVGVCALLMKILMPGPILYWQERVGHKGRRFRLAKLRTMVPDAEKESGPVWAADGDPRVTPLGRILRKTRMDELPQLLHVLKGEMSLVGPRPERPHFVTRLGRRLPSYGERVVVRPGITGWAQVNHHYDTCFEDVCEKLRYDMYYVRYMSWAIDLEILRRTVGVVVRGKGAW